MGADSGKFMVLLQHLEILLVCATSKGSVIGLVTLYAHSHLIAVSLVGFLGFQSLMGVQANLRLNMYVSTSVVDKNASVHVHLTGAGFSEGLVEPSFVSRVKVINRNVLTWLEIPSFDGTCPFRDWYVCRGARRTPSLLAVLTRRALGQGTQPGCSLQVGFSERFAA